MNKIFWILVIVVSLGFGAWLLGFWLGGCASSQQLPTTTSTSTTTTTTTTNTTTSTTTTSTTTTGLSLFRVYGTILQGECTFETTWIGLMPWSSHEYGNSSTSEVTFVSGKAYYTTETNEAGIYKVIALAKTDQNSTYVGTVGSNTGDVSAITFTPYIFEVGVPVNLIAPTFEMFTVTGKK